MKNLIRAIAETLKMPAIQCDLISFEGNVVATETPYFIAQRRGEKIVLVPLEEKVNFGATPFDVVIAAVRIHTNPPVTVDIEHTALSRRDMFDITPTIEVIGESAHV